MPQMIDGVLTWASDVEENTLAQATNVGSLPFVSRVALMADAHLGYGVPIGAVIPTKGAIIPAAVGVDIGCGMIAVETTLNASDLPDDLHGLLSRIESAIPAGLGQGHESHAVHRDLHRLGSWVAPIKDKGFRSARQLGTLGSGNHFLELCLDETDKVWVVLHSGSRGIGNKLAQYHINQAKGLMERMFIELPDRDLAYFVEHTPEFEAYIHDLKWAQAYALLNREHMMDAALLALGTEVSREGDRWEETTRINCHHNYAEMENHRGQNVWITRKGAIRARVGDMGVIPGSMGTSSYIVRGLGSESSFMSASHGAGRKMSRGQARKTLTLDSFAEKMQGRAWLDGKADKLLDEHPDAYKDIDVVMSNQADLVEVTHKLHAVLNYKGL